MQVRTGTGGARSRLLLLEPDDVYAALLEAWLPERGWEIERTRGGRQALARAAERAFDAVLVGLGGDGLDGLDFLVESRRLDAPAPVVVWAPEADELTRRTLLALGAAAVLACPTRFERIEEALVAAIGQGAARRAV